MRTHTRFSLIVSLLAGSTCLAAPAFAQEWHGAPHVGAPSGGRPAFHPSPVRGAAPGHVFVGPRGSAGFRAGVTTHPFVFQHRSFAQFTPAERAEWTGGWWRHGQWHGRWGWWWFAGGYWWWYDQPVYPYPTYVSDVYYDEPTYDQGGAGAYWYYCQNPPGYYPYVQYCRGPWQPVPPTPPQGGPGYDQGPGYGQDDQGPPPGYQGGPGDQGPPPGYQWGPGDQGPPPGYGPDDQGPPPGYQDGPPPGYQQGPPNSGQGPGYNQGPPPGYQQGPPPGGE